MCLLNISLDKSILYSIIVHWIKYIYIYIFQIFIKIKRIFIHTVTINLLKTWTTNWIQKNTGSSITSLDNVLHTLHTSQ